MAAVFSVFSVWVLITVALCLLRGYLRKKKHSYVSRNAGWELRWKRGLRFRFRRADSHKIRSFFRFRLHLRLRFRRFRRFRR